MNTLTKNIAEFTAKIEAHYHADLLARLKGLPPIFRGGKYFEPETGRACFIGCLVRSNNPALIESTYGLPVILTRVLENIFEALPMDEQPQFSRDVAYAVKVNGKDLTRVVWQFLASELRNLPPQDADIQAVIDPVIVGMGLLAAGKKWPDTRAADAADAAYAAARAAYAVRATQAAYAAARAAYAVRAAYADAYADAYAAARAARAARVAYAARATQAADAADAADAAARKRQAATILQLITDAPVYRVTA